MGYVVAGGDFQAVGIGDTVITARIDNFKAVSAITVRKNAGTIYVDSGYTAGFNDGTQEFPYESVAQGVAAATAKGAAEVLVAKGTYDEDTINVRTELNIYGGYNRSGDGDEDWKTDVQLGQAETVDFSETVININGDTGVLFQDGIIEAGIQGFTIRGDLQNENVLSIGISVQNSSVTVTNNRIEAGLASANSTAIAVNAGAPTITGNEIIGGTSELVSAGLAVTNAAPLITNNTIYAGSSEGTNVGILNQNSSPTISNNPIISSDNEAGDADPTNHFAVLNQSFSNPEISGNGNTSDPSQVITGPETGSSSSYRIKSENSSDGVIEGNTIEARLTAGILAVSSSPIISDNDITTDDTNIIGVRGENTSFVVEDNTIAARVTVTSNSVGPVLQRNYIAGKLTISGSSSGVIVTDHIVANDDENHHYSQCNGVVQIGQVLVEDGAQADITNNAFVNFRATNSATGTLSDNFIFSTSTGTIPVQITAAAVNIERNFMEILREVEGGFVRGLRSAIS